MKTYKKLKKELLKDKDIKENYITPDDTFKKPKQNNDIIYLLSALLGISIGIIIILIIN